jgi:hypothetical protein
MLFCFSGASGSMSSPYPRLSSPWLTTGLPSAIILIKAIEGAMS